MEFFDKLGKKASEAYKFTADKTGKLAKETKLKFRMSELKSQIEDLYVEIGKKVYEKHIREQDICIKKDLEEQCTKIDVLAQEIESLQNETLELRDKMQCPKCYKEIDKNDNYCKNCGKKLEKQEEQKGEAREVEILEDTENRQVEEDNEIDKSEAEKLENEIEENESNRKENKTANDVESEIESKYNYNEETIFNLHSVFYPTLPRNRKPQSSGGAGREGKIRCCAHLYA